MAQTPQVVSNQEWQVLRAELLQDEKEATHLLDKLAAKRRRLPMTRFLTAAAAAAAGGYTFTSSNGPKTLAELFAGRDQLVVYQFMDNGTDDVCKGCTAFTNNIPEHALGMLMDKGVSWVNASDMPLERIERTKAKLGWEGIPFVSSRGTTFAEDTGAGGGFLLSFFFKDGDGEVYRTYSTTQRGVDRMLFTNVVLDHCVLGRQEE